MAYQRVTQTQSVIAKEAIEYGQVVTAEGYIATEYPNTGTTGFVIGVADYSVDAGETLLVNTDGYVEAKVSTEVGQYTEQTVSGTTVSTTTEGVAASELIVGTDGYLAPKGTESADTFAQLAPGAYGSKNGDSATVYLL
jgi:hypothetical protein